MAPASAKAPADWRCRWCSGAEAHVVVDLGSQPAADHFPKSADPGPDLRFPLRMVMCSNCDLAQLAEDPTAPEEPLGVEPAVLARQAEQAVEDLTRAGLARPGVRFAEFASPHGGNWTELLRSAGLVASPTGPGVTAPVDLVVDTLGIMHEADQRKALAERVDRLSPDGAIALHVHTLASILRTNMWNALRHGHYAYYSVPVLVDMAAEFDLLPVAAWEYSLYGGTTVLVFRRTAAGRVADTGARELLERERASGATNPDVVARLGDAARRSSAALRNYLDAANRQGLKIAAFGAASRAIALLSMADVDGRDVLAVADSSPGKQGRAIPGSRIPIVSPTDLIDLAPDRVLLFVPDLLPEVRATWPQIEGDRGRWVLIDPEPLEVLA